MKKWKVFIFFLFASCVVANAQKNDTIYLMNGDRITGELKKVETALITLKTDAMKTLSIEVAKVNTIYSKKYFEFRTISGARYYGSIQKADAKGTINLITGFDTIPKPLWDLTVISPINNRFFQRIDGSIDLGLNYTKSIDVFQYNFNAWSTYRSTHASTRIDLTSILSESGDTSFSKNNDFGLNYTRYLPNKWFARAQIDVQQNTELNLEHRVQSGPAVGYDIVRTSPMRLYALAGLLVNREKLLSTVDPSINLEGLVSMYYTWDRYVHPKVDISCGLDVYPSFSVAGRVRLEFDTSIKYELLTDVFINVSYYQNYDNKPSADGFSKNDYGIVTSLGYTF